MDLSGYSFRSNHQSTMDVSVCSSIGSCALCCTVAGSCTQYRCFHTGTQYSTSYQDQYGAGCQGQYGTGFQDQYGDNITYSHVCNNSGGIHACRTTITELPLEKCTSCIGHTGAHFPCYDTYKLSPVCCQLHSFPGITGTVHIRHSTWTSKCYYINLQ